MGQGSSRGGGGLAGGGGGAGGGMGPPGGGGGAGTGAGAAARERVAREVAANAGVLMYSKTTCGYCRAAEALLRPLLDECPPARLTVVQLDREPDGAAVQAALLERTGQRTVPNCFIGRQHVGGHDDLKRLHRAGRLQPLLLAQSGGFPPSL